MRMIDLKKRQLLLWWLMAFLLLSLGWVGISARSALEEGAVQSKGALPPPAVWHVTRQYQEHKSQNRPVTTNEATAQAHIAETSTVLEPKKGIILIVIPALDVHAAVVPLGWHWEEGLQAPHWESPGGEVGWVVGSALPEYRHGSIILYGHNNMYRAVFRKLGELQPGDVIFLYTSGFRRWEYIVDKVQIVSADDKRAIAAIVHRLQRQYAPTLYLLSCWPPISNTHRVVVTAYPAQIWQPSP